MNPIYDVGAARDATALKHLPRGLADAVSTMPQP